MREIGIILLSTILVDNFILSRFLGICPFLGVSKRLRATVGMGCAVLFVMVMATMGTFPLYQLLVRNNLQYLHIVAFVLVIALFVQLVEIVLKRFSKGMHTALGVYLPLITTNCAVLGVTLLNIQGEDSFGNPFTFGQAMANAAGAGFGFLLAMVMFSGVRQRLEKADVPRAFKGIPITLLAASIVSLAFAGFGGLIEGIFQ